MAGQHGVRRDAAVPASSPWRALALAAALVGHAAAAQPTAADVAAVTEPLLARIEAEEARNGSFSRDLIELHAALGLAYQEYGEHDLAVTMLDRALYLMRFNDGLYSLDQAPLIERLAASQVEIGRPGEAAELRERLLDLARRNLTDPRSVAIFRDAAARQMSIYERYLAGDLPPVFSLTTNGGTTDPNLALGSISVARARRHYMEAIGANLRSGKPDAALLAELEEEVARSYYLQAGSMTRRNSILPGGDLVERRGMMYALGRASYDRRAAYLRGAATTTLEQARALVELADWALLFSHNGRAVDGYTEVYEQLRALRVPEAAIRELFPVDTPVFLPTFVASPVVGESAAAATGGYVDVDFEVSRYGQARRIEIVAASPDAPRAGRLVAAILGRSRFRPRPLAETEVAEYRLRYSLADGTFRPRG